MNGVAGPAEPTGRRGRYAAAISATLDEDDALRGSSTAVPQHAMSTAAHGPQPVHRRQSVGVTAPHPPTAPSPSAEPAAAAAATTGNFDFGFNSLGIPSDTTRRRYNSMPTTMNTVHDAPSRRTSSFGALMYAHPHPPYTGDGTLPAMPSNLSRTSLANNPGSASGPYGPSSSIYSNTLPSAPPQANTSLYNVQRGPGNVTSLNSTMLGSMQNPSFVSAGPMSQSAPLYGSFMTPAGAASGRGYAASSSASSCSGASSTGSSTLHRDMNFLGLDSIATDSFRGDGSLSRYPAPTSAYGVPPRGASFTSSAMPGSFMQPIGTGAGGGSLMAPAGSGGFGAGPGTSMVGLGNSGDGSLYGTSRASFNQGLSSQYGSARRSFAASSSSMTRGNSMLGQSMPSMSLLSTSAFHPELASFQGEQRSAHMAITPASAATPASRRSTQLGASQSSTQTRDSGVTRWVRPEEKSTSTTRRGRRTSAPWKSETNQNVMGFSIGAAVRFMGLDYVGAAATSAGVSALAIIEHHNAAPSDLAGVRSTDGFDIHVVHAGRQSVCAADECLWRPCGGNGLSSDLLSDAARQFAEAGENAFVWLLDRSVVPNDKDARGASVAPAGPVSMELATSICRKAVSAVVKGGDGKATSKAEATELIVSVIAYHPPPPLSSSTTKKGTAANAQFTELLASFSLTPSSSSSSVPGRRDLEVATSPITGSCANGCVAVSVASVSEFDKLAQSASENAARLGTSAGTEGCIVLWQLSLLQRTSPSDVLLASFTVASAAAPAAIESVLDQNAGSQWALFKYGLGLGPCTIVAVVCVEENDQGAAEAFATLERLRYHSHLGPRAGSVRGWMEEAEDRVAELDTLDDMLLMDAVSGAAATASAAGGDSRGVTSPGTVATTLVREKLHKQRTDFGAFLRSPSLSTAPLYVVDAAVPRAVRTLCVDAEDTSSKLSAAPPFFSAYVRRLDDALGPRTAAATVVEALSHNVVVVRQKNRPGMPFGGFEEACVVAEANKGEEYTAGLAQSAAVSNLESLFIRGFNTCVLGLSPMPVSSEQSTASCAGGSPAGEEAAMSGVRASVGLAVRSVFDRIEKEQSGTVLRCCLSMYHVRDTDMVDLLDGEATPTFSPLTLVISPLLGTAPNLITQRPLRSFRDYESAVQQGLRQLRVVNRRAQDSDKDYLSYTVLSVELKQLRNNHPGDVYVSVMAGVSLGENYNVLGDPSIFYDKARVAAPCVALLKSFLAQCARSHCVAFLDEATTMEVATLLGRVYDLKRVETRPINVGSVRRLVERLTKVRARLQADQRLTSRGQDNVGRVEGMLNDAAQLLDSPQTTDVVYYLRWADDDDALDARTVNAATGRGSRRGSQVKIRTPAALVNGRALNGSVSGRPGSAASLTSPRVPTSPPSAPSGRPGRAPRRTSLLSETGLSVAPDATAAPTATPAQYDQALAACRAAASAPALYYGTQYKRDPVLAAPSSPSDGLHVPSLVLLRPSSALDEAGIAARGDLTALALRDAGTATTTYYAADEVVVVPTADKDSASRSQSLSRCVTCAAAGCTAAVLLADTAPLTAEDSLSWTTVRQTTTALLAALEREASSQVPFLLSARAMLLPEADPGVLSDLLGDKATVDVLKYSPVCGPTAKDAGTMSIKNPADVAAFLDRVHASLPRPDRRRASSSSSAATAAEVRGAVAIQLVAHRFVQAADDVQLSSLWLVCGDALGDWLSTATAQPKSCTAKLLDFWLGGPCFTTAVLAITPPSSLDDLGLRRRFARLSKVQDSFRAVTLGTPRNGSVAQFEAYLEALVSKAADDTTSPRLAAMRSEAAQLRQKKYDKCVSSEKPPGLLAHEPRMFTMMDS